MICGITAIDEVGEGQVETLEILAAFEQISERLQICLKVFTGRSSETEVKLSDLAEHLFTNPEVMGRWLFGIGRWTEKGVPRHRPQVDSAEFLSS